MDNSRQNPYRLGHLSKAKIINGRVQRSKRLVKANAHCGIQALIAVVMMFAHGAAIAQTQITYEVTALIDVADLLIIHGHQMQWHHPGSGAAVGRHSGRNEATTITSTLDGVTNMDAFAWIPTWPEPPPAQIRYDAFSSVLDGIAPALPSGDVVANVVVLAGRGSASLAQLPDSTNDWTLIVGFADGATGSALLNVRITVQFVPLRLVAINSTRLEARWPTTASPYQLESTASLPAQPDDWIAITNQPLVVDQGFVLPIEVSAPQRFFRLRKL
jgi:hypothetical protein